MIGKLTGILYDKNPPEVLVDGGGVGYEVQMPTRTFSSGLSELDVEMPYP